MDKVPRNEIDRAVRLEKTTLNTNEKTSDMATKEVNTYTLSEMKDKYIGKASSTERDEYEYELRMDVLGKMIKAARKERHLTQEQLGKLVGVRKAQISKLESNAAIDTILKVFKALKTEINFNVKLEDKFVKVA